MTYNEHLIERIAILEENEDRREENIRQTNLALDKQIEEVERQKAIISKLYVDLADACGPEKSNVESVHQLIDMITDAYNSSNQYSN